MDKQTPTIKIAFLDVGQGDTIVISSPDTHEAIVVDCIDSNAVLDYLTQEKIKYLRGIVVSHLHEDHYKQVDDLLNRYFIVPGMQECEKLAFIQLINEKNREELTKDVDGHQEQIDYVQDADGHQEQIDYVQEEQKKLASLKKARRTRNVALTNMYGWCKEDKRRFNEPGVEEEPKPLPFKGILKEYISVIHPYRLDLIKLKATGLNNTSAVLHVKGFKSSALLTGDLEPEGWKMLRANHTGLQSDVLKFPHHGGAWNTATTKDLLDTIRPSTVVISVGTEGEKYKHPNKDVLETLSSPAYSHIRVLCTQATSQCMESVLNQKISVIQHLDQLASSQGLERIGSKRGCPCAGSIIIELGDKACVLQPSVTFHRDTIILPHFFSHKCKIT